MTRIMISGVTNRPDALAAVEAGADALGFIAIPGNPRSLEPQEYFEITENLPIFVRCVGVFERPGEYDDYMPDYVQHYEDTAAESRATGLAGIRIRVFRMRDESTLNEIRDYPDPVGAILLDMDHAGTLYGSGETFDWSLAVRAKALTDRPIILSGGLTPENVGAAIARVRPYAVDVTEGVESPPGVKDPNKMRAFVEAVREAR